MRFRAYWIQQKNAISLDCFPPQTMAFILLPNLISPITNYQSPITNYQLPITNYQFPIQTDNNRTASPKGNSSKAKPPGVTTHKTGNSGAKSGKLPYPSVK